MSGENLRTFFSEVEHIFREEWPPKEITGSGKPWRRREILRCLGLGTALGLTNLISACNTGPTAGDRVIVREGEASEFLTLRELASLDDDLLFGEIYQTNEILNTGFTKYELDQNTVEARKYVNHLGNLTRLLTVALDRHLHGNLQLPTTAEVETANRALIQHPNLTDPDWDALNNNNVDNDFSLKVESFDFTLESLVYSWFELGCAEATVGDNDSALASFNSSQQLAEAYLSKKHGEGWRDFLKQDYISILNTENSWSEYDIMKDPVYVIWSASLKKQAQGPRAPDFNSYGNRSVTRVVEEFLNQAEGVADMDQWRSLLEQIFTARQWDLVLQSSYNDPVLQAYYEAIGYDYDNQVAQEVQEIWESSEPITNESGAQQIYVNVRAGATEGEPIWITAKEFIELIFRNGSVDAFPEEIQRLYWSKMTGAEGTSLDRNWDAVVRSGERAAVYVLNRDGTLGEWVGELKPGDTIPLFDNGGSILQLFDLAQTPYILIPRGENTYYAVKRDQVELRTYLPEMKFTQKKHGLLWLWTLYGSITVLSESDLYPLKGALNAQLVNRGPSTESVGAIMAYVTGLPGANAVWGDVKYVQTVTKLSIQAIIEAIRR